MQYSLLQKNFHDEFKHHYTDEFSLLEYLEKSQYTYIPLEDINNKVDILTKLELRKHIPKEGLPFSKTSGTTGIPVLVTKTSESMLWFTATNLRELLWRKWDLSKLAVSILARHSKDRTTDLIYEKKLDSIKNLQRFLEKVQPYYLYTYPSIIQLLDLTKLKRLIDIKSVGEVGGTNYSSEETGTIALMCPDNPDVYHVMENIIVETDDIHGVIITDLTNPLIKRYALGDVVELGKDKCLCGRSLKTISKIKGRVRNMLVLENIDNNKVNLDRIWPTFGEPEFRSITDKIIRHQIIQKTLKDIEISLQVTNPLDDIEMINFMELVNKNIVHCGGHSDYFIFEIKYVDGFPIGKFEPFKTEV